MGRCCVPLLRLGGYPIITPVFVASILALPSSQMKSMLDNDPASRSGLVMYGMNIQLRHLNSSKYLNAENFTALQEKDCLRLSLSPGSMNCALRILPRFKVRHEGSEIYFRDQVLLYSLRMPEYGLHASSRVFDPLESKPSISEVNLSVKPSSFRVDKFARFSTAQRSSVMFESIDLVRFSHPESDSFLSHSCGLSKSSKPPYLRKNSEEVSHDISSKGMWAIEALNATSKPVQWGKEVRIRHLATSKYLAVSETPKVSYCERSISSMDIQAGSPTPVLPNNTITTTLLTFGAEMVQVRRSEAV